MVEGNFRNKQSGLKGGQGKRSKHSPRFGLMDPFVLMTLAGFSQPLGQWILKYALAEVDIKQVNYDRLLFSAMMLGIGLLIIIAWYIYSSKRR